jgi:uncharacterized protein
MSPAPADQVNAKELAGRAATITRSLGLRQLPRLAEAGAREGTHVEAQLRFGTFEDRVTVEVRLEGGLVLTCQRCLQPCECAIDEQAQLVVVPNDAEDALGGFEPLIGDAERVSLEELIEEQALLALPLVPMHAAGERCSTAKTGARGRPEKAAAGEDEKQTPFANLRELLDKGER